MVRILAAIGLALLIGAGFGAFETVSTEGVDCGSWVARDDSKAKHSDLVNSLANSMTGTHSADEDSAAQSACNKAISDRTPLVAALGILGIASLIGAAILHTRRPAVAT